MDSGLALRAPRNDAEFLAHPMTFQAGASPIRDRGTDGSRENIMATTIGINGFGRIGRLVFRALVEQNLLGEELNVVVNDLVPADNLAYLLKYDTTQGRFRGTVASRKSSPSVAEDDV